MSDAQNTTPNDLLIETIAALLIKVGGYKDAAEAVLNATDMIQAIASSDHEEAILGLSDFQTLVTQAAGASNYIAASTQDDADQTVRFVKDEEETQTDAKTPEAEAQLTDPIEALRAGLAEALGIPAENLMILPAGVDPSELFGISKPLRFHH